MVDDRTALVDLLRARSVRHGDFVLASGARSRYYIDCRPTTMSAHGQQLIGRLGLALIHANGWAPNAVGGLTMGADPVAYAIAHASFEHGAAIDAFSVRKEAKAHGTGRRIEGNFVAGARVVVVEDVITSGGSAISAIDAVRAEGGDVAAVIAVVDRQAGGIDRIAQSGVVAYALVTASELGIES